MTSVEQQQYERNEAIARAQECGVVWLNDVFRFKDDRMTIFRKIRISKLEIVWGVVVLLTWWLVGYLLHFALDWNRFGKVLLHPFILPAEGIPLGYYFGRRIPHYSPLRKKTQEGMSVWLGLVVHKGLTRVGRFVGRQVVYSRCETRVRNKLQHVECIEWVGSSRAPYMPAQDSRGQHWTEPNVIQILPRGVPLPYSLETKDLLSYDESRVEKAMKRARRQEARLTKKLRRRGVHVDATKAGWVKSA